MNPDNLKRMGAEELDAYAKALGFSVIAGRTAEDKARLIEERRRRAARVECLGVDLSIEVRKARDRRVSALLAKEDRTGADVAEAFRLMLGQEQYDELERAATDEDGVVDEAALTCAFNRILDSDELKNS